MEDFAKKFRRQSKRHQTTRANIDPKIFGMEDVSETNTYTYEKTRSRPIRKGSSSNLPVSKQKVETTTETTRIPNLYSETTPEEIFAAMEAKTDKKEIKNNFSFKNSKTTVERRNIFSSSMGKSTPVRFINKINEENIQEEPMEGGVIKKTVITKTIKKYSTNDDNEDIEDNNVENKSNIEKELFDNQEQKEQIEKEIEKNDIQEDNQEALKSSKFDEKVETKKIVVVEEETESDKGPKKKSRIEIKEEHYNEGKEDNEGGEEPVIINKKVKRKESYRKEANESDEEIKIKKEIKSETKINKEEKKPEEKKTEEDKKCVESGGKDNYQVLFNQLENNLKIIEEKNNIIEKLQKKIRSIEEDDDDKGKFISVHFISSSDERINNSFVGRVNESFSRVEEKLYSEFPDLAELENNTFKVNKKKVFRFKTLKENGITKDGTKVKFFKSED